MKTKLSITRKAIFISFALFIASMSINAQSNFRQGYIITNEMDTISGLIDFRTYKMNAHACKFKASGTSEEKVFSPGDIYGYRFTDDGKYYVTKDINIDDQQQKVFLEYLIQGLVSLYFYPGEESDYYFFQDESGRMIPVTKQDKVILDDKTRERRFSEDNRYKSTIGYIFRDSESVSKATNNMLFDQKKMIELTKKYHAEMCKTGEECIQFETKSDKYNKLKISVYAGMQFQTYKFGSIYIEHNPAFKFLPEFSYILPEIGTQLDFSIPRRNKSISLVLDVSLAKLTTEKQETLAMYENITQYARLEANGLVVSGKLGAKYTYHKGLFRPLIEGGFMVNRLFLSSTYYSYSSTSTNVRPYAEDFLCPLMMGFYAGTGFDYHLKKDNAILFRVGYNEDQEMNSKKREDKDTTSAWYFKLGYTF
ncbi:MAG: hypothetical protein LBI82_08520 [Dysgonamonadaceae bacterium]|jgi:hypothetical protein|nr:hypothetical protein [Dysgonamonadaceae bacterium]